MHDALALADLAATIATDAGRLIIAGRQGAEVAASKSSVVDIVTQMDIASEAFIAERLAQLRPADGLLGEEGAATEGSSGITWVVDPIDGTVNYLYGIPHYAVSIAAVTGGTDPHEWTVLAGAVFDGDGVLWKAAKGHGSWRNGERLHRKDAGELSTTLLATGFQYTADRRLAQGRIVASMLGEVRDIRRLGAASVDLCLAAAGRIDAYYEHGLKPWDFAAGALIATEAGLKVAGIDGGAADGHLLIAAVPSVWDALRDALESAGARQPFDTPRR